MTGLFNFRIGSMRCVCTLYLILYFQITSYFVVQVYILLLERRYSNLLRLLLRCGTSPHEWASSENIVDDKDIRLQGESFEPRSI